MVVPANLIRLPSGKRMWSEVLFAASVGLVADIHGERGYPTR